MSEETTEKRKTDLVKISGIWVNKDKNNRTYLTGQLGGARIVILKNDFREDGTNQPNYNLFIAPFQKKTEGNEIDALEEEHMLEQFNGGANPEPT